jgi:phospholipid N-methyltransferase
MHENVQFIQAFLKNPLKVGAIAPSSSELTERMLEDIRPDKNAVVLELGVGTGAFTKRIKEITPNKDSYLGIELDRGLIQCLRKKFPDMHFMRGNACKSFAIHKRSELGKVGFILSGLPFVSMPNDVNDRIFAQIEKFMEQGCMFRTFQYAHGYYMPSAIKLREFMRDRYGESNKSPLIIKNVPPAVTLTWQTK